MVEKYQNPRALATAFLNPILELEPNQVASASCLNILLDTFDSAFQALGKLNINDLADVAYSYLLLSKLDSETKSLFENTSRSSSLLTYKETLKFIKEQARIYSMSPVNARSIVNKVSKSHNYFVEKVTSKLECVVCASTKQHLISQCDEFSSMGRFEKVKFLVSDVI
ncbi:hypothetical protein HHI36_013116 [Cryptolaemus montrouzieri]|uniref:Uncharacterized protein n=1 Tax=Cryptolaemus montrouzieri TaxID=559131 RepID=A0ABD2NGV1_9CUCU